MVEVGPVVTDISCAQEVATLACGHQLPITGRGDTIIRRLFCGKCLEGRDVLVFRPLDADGNVVQWPGSGTPG